MRFRRPFRLAEIDEAQPLVDDLVTHEEQIEGMTLVARIAADPDARICRHPAKNAHGKMQTAMRQ